MRLAIRLLGFFEFSILSLFVSIEVCARPKGQIVAIDNSIYVAMVDESIEYCSSVQEMENWCWAACIQMILRYNGMEEDQVDIVNTTFEYPYDWTASGNEIVDAFDGWNGYSVRSFKTKTAQSFINEISAGHPLIIGYKGHAYLLTHIFYKKFSSGDLNPFKVVMINPATGCDEVFDWSEFFSKLNTIISFHK